MRLEEWKYAFISFTALLLLGASSPILIDLLPPSSEESFFALALLGKEGLAEKYYPGEDLLINPDTPVKWNIYAYNHMGEAQQIIVKVKLVTSNIPSPDSSTCTPSPAIEIYEIRRVVLDNETMILPFEWTITESKPVGESLNILKIKINEYTVKTNVNINEDEILKMIFELWVYDKNMQQFIFSWLEQGERRCAWNQINFKATS